MSDPSPQNLVKLLVNGNAYSGWKSVRIAAGVERMARDFEVSVSGLRSGGLPLPSTRINPGDFVRVMIGSDVVASGYVDATPLEYDAHGYTMLIRGRSRTADLIDSSPDDETQQWKATKAEGIAKDLAKPYGVGIVAEAPTGEPLIEHQIQQGETVFESLERIAAQRQMLITDNPYGELVFAKPGSAGRADTALVLGDNILSASAGFDFSEVYSEIRVKGQRAGDDENFGAKVNQGLGRATDSSVRRKRVLVVRQPGQADAKTLQDRADYEQQVRRAKAGEIRYRVAEWRQKSGRLWQPNQSVRIQDPWMGQDGDLLISEVIFLLSEAGMVTELVVIAPGAFATNPQDAASKKTAQDLGQGAEWVILPGSTASTTPAHANDAPTWVDFDKPK